MPAHDTGPDGEISSRDVAGKGPGDVDMNERSVTHRHWRPGRLIMAALLALLPWSGLQAATLEDIGFSALPNDVTQLELTFDGPPPEPYGYTIDDPARIALDLEGVRSGLAERRHNLGSGNARSLTVVEAGDRTRLIISLAELVAYESSIEGNRLLVRVGGSPRDMVPGQVPEQRQAAATARGEVADIDFRRGQAGEGKVEIRLSDAQMPIDVRREGRSVRVRIRGASLPERLRRRLDVTDFATPVERIDALTEGDDVVIELRQMDEFDYLAYQSDRVLTVDVRAPEDDTAAAADDPFRYQGEELSFNFQDIDVRAVLQIIADFTDMNLVASDSVTGRITLRLQNVPWDQALDIVLRTRGLDKREVGNVLMVAPAAEIAARERQELDNQRQLQELSPLRTEFIQVRYADAARMVQLFQEAGGEARLLSERGSAVVDERTNSIILTDTSERLNDLRRVLQQLDIPVRQVQIEARIVTANTNFTESLGIRWGGGWRGNVGGNNFLSIGGGLNAGTTSGGIPDGGVVNLPAGQATSAFAVGITGEDYLLDLELSALSTDGHAEVVARPKVITADKQTATVASGVEIPFQEAAASGATATQFKEAVLSLAVTPQITPDDRIIMDLQVNQDSVGQVFGGIPSINTNAINTQVLVDNGQTLVLGGIFSTSTNETIDKTPVLGDLPLVGGLFRRSLRNEEKQELLIFITPRIIQDTLTQR